MPKSLPPRPIKIYHRVFPEHSSSCSNDMLCRNCNNFRTYSDICYAHKVDRETLLSLPIPGDCVVVYSEFDLPNVGGHPGIGRNVAGFQFIKPDALLDYMSAGAQMILNDVYNKRDEAFIESNPHLNPTTLKVNVKKEEKVTTPTPVIEVPKEEKLKKSNKLAFTKEEILAALVSEDNVNAAIAYLGDMQTEDELKDGSTNHLNDKGFTAAYGKTGRHLWVWVTGKDSRNNFEVKWEPKSLAHTRANRTFAKFVRNYDEIETAIDLGRHISKIHWKQLGFIVADGYVVTPLPVVDKPREKVDKDKVVTYFDLTGAKVTQKSGRATQIRWDSRKIWLPNSQLKVVGGKLQVPTWLAKKNGMI